MSERVRIALGVDIGPREVCAALVRRDRRQLVLIHAARAPLPEGVIQDGRVRRPLALAKVLAGLKDRRWGLLKAGPSTGVSVSGASARLQILELPDPLPGNIGGFVRGEIGQSVTLGAAGVVSDYCALESAGGRRLLAAVADGRHVLSLVEACQGSLGVVHVVEPRLLSALRALQAKGIKPSSGHCMVVLLTEKRMDLGVFRAGCLEYIRSQDLSDAGPDPEALGKRLAREIDALVRYREMESAPASQGWRILVLPEDGVVLQADASGRLSPRGSNAEVEILTPVQIGPALGVECPDPALWAKASPSAVGLAMRLLEAEAFAPGVNLLPPEVTQRRTARRASLIAALVAAAALAVMAGLATGLAVRTEGLRRDLAQKREVGRIDAMVDLVVRHRDTKARIDALSAGLGRIEEILQTQRRIDWTGVLDDVRNGTPEGVYVTRLASTESGRPELVVDGFSFQSGAPYGFAQRLHASGRIAAATLVKSGQETAGDRPYFVYRIRCVMRCQEGT